MPFTGFSTGRFSGSRNVGRAAYIQYYGEYQGKSRGLKVGLFFGKSVEWREFSYVPSLAKIRTLKELIFSDVGFKFDIGLSFLMLTCAF